MSAQKFEGLEAHLAHAVCALLFILEAEELATRRHPPQSS